MFEVLRNRSIAHHLDDWGPEAGHDWPYTRYTYRMSEVLRNRGIAHQMWKYVTAHLQGSDGSIAR